jgi:transitional endoplasmic reticulum ATPase
MSGAPNSGIGPTPNEPGTTDGSVDPAPIAPIPSTPVAPGPTPISTPTAPKATKPRTPAKGVAARKPPTGKAGARPTPGRAPPTRRSAPPSRVPKRGTPGYRTFWVLFAAGLILAGTGVALIGTFYPDVVHAQTAEQFLVSSGARMTTSNALSVVYLTAPGLSPGNTIVIKDTVSQAQYDAATGTTSLTFASIAALSSAQRSQFSGLAADLFATVAGHPSWISGGTPIVLTFTVVQQKLPGGPYGGQTYLTLDAAADATNHAIQSGASGPSAVAIGQQYLQPSPAPLYDYLFYFLTALGALSLAAAFLWARRMETWLKHQTKEPKALAIGIMGALALFGGFFQPFYPWVYVVFIFVPAVMLIAWRFPQLSLLVLLLLVVPEVGYQSGAMGLIFLFAALPILFASLLDFRFGVGAFLTLFLAPVGLSFTVPIFMTLIFSLYLGIAVAVVGGVLISLFVTLGNLPVLGYLVGPGASGSPSLIAGHSAALSPTLPIPYFSFTSVGSAWSNVVSPDFSSFANGGTGLGGLALPLIEIGAWCFACWLCATVLKDRTFQTTERVMNVSMVSGGTIAAVTLTAFVLQGYTEWTTLAVLLILPGMFTAVAGSLVIRDAFDAYFTSRLGASSVGTRIAEMKGLQSQKVTFEMVGGLHDVKADIKESMIIPLMRKDVTTRFKLDPPKGILLFGPPGCGKTMLMKALASELGVEMISAKCSDLMSKWYGESENRVAELLRTARERAPTILFLDEIDSIAKRRDMYTADDVTPRLLSILLSEMDGLDKSSGVIVVGSTNKPDLIDPALMRPGRLDKIIYVPPPDYEERIEIVQVHLNGRPYSKDIDLKEVAKKTERYSGADLANLVREAATRAVKREMSSLGKTAATISMDDFSQVLPRIKPSISLRMIADYETMKMDYERKMHQSVRSERKTLVHWDDVGGLEDVKAAIREYVELPLTRPELMESYKIKTGRGILLFGPPGCGKTHVMRAAANELNVPIQIVNGPELVSALAGQSEAAVRDVLYRARENAPSIVFFDEIDALASKDSMRTPEVSRAVSQFLTEMDGLRAKDKVMIIATTNRPQTLDPALLRPGRFDKIFYVPPPDTKARSDIFRIHMKGVPVDGSTIDYDDLANRTAGYSGADIASAVDESKLLALREQVRLEMILPAADLPPGNGSTQPPAAPPPAVGVTMSDLLRAVNRTKSSVTSETMAWSEEFIHTYGTRG